MHLAGFDRRTGSWVKALKVRQIERITTEAWQRDAVLTMLDLEWLLNVNGAFIRQMLDAYQERFGVLHFGLPPKLMAQVMGNSLNLVEEHLALADKHFPTREALVQYLEGRGVSLENAG